MANIKKKEISKLFESGADFELTNEQYHDLTGRDFPNDRYYFKTKSSVSKIAKENDYDIVFSQELIVKFIKRS